MPKFYGYGDVTIELLDENDNVIGIDYGHKPVYEIEAESLEDAQSADPESWEYTGDSNGTIGADFVEGYDYDDVCAEIWVVHQIYDIYEE